MRSYTKAQQALLAARKVKLMMMMMTSMGASL